MYSVYCSYCRLNFLTRNYYIGGGGGGGDGGGRWRGFTFLVGGLDNKAHNKYRDWLYNEQCTRTPAVSLKDRMYHLFVVLAHSCNPSYWGGQNCGMVWGVTASGNTGFRISESVLWPSNCGWVWRRPKFANDERRQYSKQHSSSPGQFSILICTIWRRKIYIVSSAWSHQ